MWTGFGKGEVGLFVLSCIAFDFVLYVFLSYLRPNFRSMYDCALDVFPALISFAEPSC